MPVVHGSALYQAGETQSLATATVSTLAESGEGASSLVVHFTAPPFASNEVHSLLFCERRWFRNSISIRWYYSDSGRAPPASGLRHVCWPRGNR